MIEELGSLYGKWLWWKFENAARDPEQTQRRLLDWILRKNADTAFGRDHRFHALRSPEDYRRAVPVRIFKELSGYVDRVADGETRVLTREPVVFFNQSSGTSGKQKLIPVTPSWLRDTARLRVIWGTRTSRDHPALMRGKTISVVYAAYGGKTPGGIEYGSLSGRVSLQSPASLRRRYALPYAIARIRDPESKQYASMRLAMTQNVTFLFSTNPATVLSMVETGERRREELLRDIHDGSLSPSLNLPEGVREDLLLHCQADPAGARRLEKMAEQNSGRLRPMHYWPGCAAFGCWLASTVGAAARDIPAWFGPNLVPRDLGLAASEGVFTLPFEDRTPFGPLTVASNYYEFIPVGESDRENPPVLNAWELQDGAEYVLVLTTTAGLYRYNINDVVRVRGWFQGTPMLEFIRKGSDSANLAGEKMEVSQILGAVEAARRATGLEIAHFRAQADADEMRYRFHLELRGPLPPGAKETLAAELEKALQAGNAYYAKWIGEKQLKPLEVRLMKPGWFDRYVEEAMANGARHGQFKPALLTMKPEPAHEYEKAGDSHGDF